MAKELIYVVKAADGLVSHVTHLCNQRLIINASRPIGRESYQTGNGENRARGNPNCAIALDDVP